MELSKLEAEYLASLTTANVKTIGIESGTSVYRKKMNLVGRLLEHAERKVFKSSVGIECSECKFIRTEDNKFYCAIDGCTAWEVD